MEIQENQHGSFSESESAGSTRSVGYSGPLSGPLISCSRNSSNTKRSARFKDEECYVEITLDVRDDSVSVQNIRGGDSETAYLASQLEKRPSLGSQLSFKLKQVSQELRRMTSSKRFNRVDRTKSGAARALQGLRFMSKNVGTDGWSEVEARFTELAVNGMLPKSLFGQCIGMKESSEFASEVFDALARRRGITSSSITKAELHEFWEQIADQSFDARLQTFFDMVDKNADGRITEEEVKEIIALSASANKLSKIQESAHEYAGSFRSGHQKTKKKSKMSSRFEVEVKVSTARDLKNVNWRHGPLRPYAVVWVDPNKKSSTRVDDQGDTCPHWDETLVIPVPGSIEEYSTLYIDIVHAGRAEEDVSKPLVGSARLKLTEVLDDVGFGDRAQRSLQLKRTSGRPHGKVDVKVEIRQPRYRAADPYYAPSYGVPPPSGSRSLDYSAPPAYGNPYAAPPQDPYYSAPPPAGYPPYGGYNAPAPAPYGAPAPASYGAPAPAPYGAPAPAPYGQPSYGQEPYGGEYRQVEEKKKNKFGMGTGLAVGAVAGVLGGLAIKEGFDYVEDKIADNAADKVEDNLDEERFDDDDGGYDGDDY